MKIQRESNFDLLRIICAIAVISIHVSDTYVFAFESKDIFGSYYTMHFWVSTAYNVLSRFAVPCFCMLSGAFILTDQRNIDYKYFYKKSFKNIGVQTIIFSLLYFAYSIFRVIVAVILKVRDVEDMWLPVKQLLAGKPFYHMWYLYMLIGIYLLAPFVIRFKDCIGEENFSKVVWIFWIVSCISGWTSTHEINWDIGLSACYLGYFMLGFEIRKNRSLHMSNIKGGLLVILGILTEVFLAILCYRAALDPDGVDLLHKIASAGPFAPLVMAASVLIFAGFSMMDIRKDFGKLSSYTFLIYLAHGGICDIFKRGTAAFWGVENDNRIFIPVCIVGAFLLSYLFAVVYKKIWDKLEDKFSMSNRILHLIHL